MLLHLLAKILADVWHKAALKNEFQYLDKKKTSSNVCVWLCGVSGGELVSTIYYRLTFSSDSIHFSRCNQFLNQFFLLSCGNTAHYGCKCHFDFKMSHKCCCFLNLGTFSHLWLLKLTQSSVLPSFLPFCLSFLLEWENSKRIYSSHSNECELQ